MKLNDFVVGMHVVDPLPSLGYGTVVRVCSKTVWVKFVSQEDKTIYDLEHIQFLEKAA